MDESGKIKHKTLDLHTSELPIHPSSMSHTLAEAGFKGLLSDGIVDVFCVHRTTSGDDSTDDSARIGKSEIYHEGLQWAPQITQSDRGIAMFLSSLRVFASIVQDMSDDERTQDAVLHAFDLLTKFPPALRALHVLISGKTPTASESAAISHIMFEVLSTFVPTDVIGTDQTRVFEGSRLLFGFMLEKARDLKLPGEEGATMPYLSSLQTLELRDQTTDEAVKSLVQTTTGVTEANLFHAFQDGEVLHDSHLQKHFIKVDADPDKTRQALLAGGLKLDITVFSARRLFENYRYGDSGNVENAFGLDELSELDTLAEFCGRNKLAVHKPSQLTSAVSPALTFDRLAHLAVYTGEQPCGTPGQSSMVFRPKHGEENIEPSIIEQLIAPLMRQYEAEGSAVFDAFGGATLKRLQAPDEVLMFVVDTSSSMGGATDFPQVNDGIQSMSDGSGRTVVEPEFFNRASFDDMKERLCDYEGFNEMTGIIYDANTMDRRRPAAAKVLDALREMLLVEIQKVRRGICANL